ncbi:MAG: hypothetical protein WCR45_03620 [Bacteroidaceae bacterium]|nr:hypothetical protein [Bacteroidaceae bacterium]
MKKKDLYIIPVLMLLLSCTPSPRNVILKDMLPLIYPDYTDVAIPYNVAPMNFLLRNGADALEVVIRHHCEGSIESGSEQDSLVIRSRGNKACFPLSDWKSFLKREKGSIVNVQVTARVDGMWIRYRAFHWTIVSDAIDPYLSYRLIEPGYEVWNNIQLVQRNIETFDESVISDYHLVNNACMNCHIYGNQNPRLSLMHIRGKGGGTLLNRNGQLRKLSIKNKLTISAGVYAAFHPQGRYGVFSTNQIIPEFHATGSKRLEVYDAKSDVIVADFDKDRILISPLLSDSTALETFPVFSAQGKWIYFCTVKALKLPENLKQLKYSLCRIAFDASTGQFGTKVDTLYNARIKGKSVCEPKTSPDGRWILYTVADYGTFPIWHRESDLQLMDLKTSAIDSLPLVNSSLSDTYHSWSSNSRWFVFASKRDDGIYGKPYFCYIDKEGKTYKPFVLPQKDPSSYDQTLKSFNIPELATGMLPFTATDVERWFHDTPIENFK